MLAMSETNATVRIRSFELGPYATNCFVVTAGGDACWIVDAGFSPGELIEAVRAERLRCEKIILTHAHIDHIAGLGEIRRACEGVPVWAHPSEFSWFDDPALNLSGAMGMPFTTNPPDHALDEGDVLTLGDSEWSVLHTPGHSPGSLTLVEKKAGIAIVGDTLFSGSIGRSDFPTSNEADLHSSIREKIYALPDETVVYPGHGPNTRVGLEKTSNPYVRA